MATLRTLKEAGATVVVSTHRTGLLQAVDKILLLRDGKVQMFGPKDELTRPRPAGVEDASVPSGRQTEDVPGISNDSDAPKAEGVQQ
ncbi:hypothetical protein NHF48_023150 [Sphingomonas sp. H160509]|uniref:hypothetical protein n=1 Tax=Sphingomonas sp. H160509 TaxID=2955313 RepID=UPI002098585B|nr:hypothetical protein [Sphingomonas sp. H160509]MDD1453164.1 hypothetical protein [Sphingomonas sp. H160509]